MTHDHTGRRGPYQLPDRVRSQRTRWLGDEYSCGAPPAIKKLITLYWGILCKIFHITRLGSPPPGWEEVRGASRRSGPFL